MTIKELLTIHLETVDEFVHQSNNETLKAEYVKRTLRRYFQENIGGYTSEQLILTAVVNSLDEFMMILPIHETVNFVRFFEKRNDMPWKQVFITSGSPSKTKLKESYAELMAEIEQVHGDTQWWKQAYFFDRIP